MDACRAIQTTTVQGIFHPRNKIGDNQSDLGSGKGGDGFGGGKEKEI